MVLFKNPFYETGKWQGNFFYDLKGLKRLGKKPKSIQQVVGKRIDGKGYYAELMKSRFFYEKHVIAFIPIVSK